ncbi:SCO family protein [Paenibacillaceae bacterium]|nr:SCO family protein [Paenibacillaceae bacterium]
MEKSSKSSTRPFVIAFGALLLCFIVYLALPLFQSGSSMPVLMSSPDFTLTDMEGNEVQRSAFDGKVQLVEFFFTSCPDICPATTAHMVQMEDALKQKNWFGTQVAFTAISFNSEVDTPEVLAKYAEQMGMDLNGWTILHGDEEVVWDLASNYNISVKKLPDGQFVHTITSLLLIDGKHQVRKVYRMGEEIDREQVLADIEVLVKEAS